MNANDLKAALDQLGVNPDRYDLRAGVPRLSEGLVLGREGGKWAVRHFERGSWYTLASFDSEDEACRKFLEYASDPFYRAPTPP